MKSPITYILVLIALSGSSLKANWPGGVSFSANSAQVSRSNLMASVVGFSSVKKNQVKALSFTSMNYAPESLSTDFLTGLVKKGNTKPKFNIFTWDFKVKVRLNRSLSLIITYS